MWESLVIVLCVVWAAAYVGWRVRSALRSTGHSGCGSCPASQEATGLKTKPLVSLDLDPPDTSRSDNN